MLVLITSCSYTPVTSFKDDIILQIIMRGFERSFSYTPYGFSVELLLHSSAYAVLLSSFCYTPRAGFSEEFLVDSSSWF